MAGWLCFGQRDPPDLAPGRRIDDPLRRRRRRHHAADRDRLRLPARDRRAQPRRLSALAGDDPRPLIGAPGPYPPHLGRDRSGARAAGGDPQRRRRRGRAPDRSGVRGAALHRHAGDDPLRPRAGRAVAAPDPVGARPRRPGGDRDDHPVLPRRRLRLAGQLHRPALARWRPNRPVRLADPGEHRRNQLRRRRHPGGRGRPALQPRRSRAARGRAAGASLLAGGADQRHPASGI